MFEVNANNVFEFVANRKQIFRNDEKRKEPTFDERYRVAPEDLKPLKTTKDDNKRTKDDDELTMD